MKQLRYSRLWRLGYSIIGCYALIQVRTVADGINKFVGTRKVWINKTKTYSAILHHQQICYSSKALGFSQMEPISHFSSFSAKSSKSPLHPAYDIVLPEEEFGCGLDISSTMYRHKNSGAHVLSISTSEAEKEMVFNVCFPTPPVDSSGVSHIVEHSVLSGSVRFPVKDAFFHIVKSNLFTFLNAYTFNDMTCYPCASTNLKDFYNIADMYLDAVFHPLAIGNPIIFQTEGWHYEIVSKNDTITTKDQDDNKRNERLIINGIVYNEMKGRYSSSVALALITMEKELFPMSYPHESGGNPDVIPSLTYEKFKTFYEKNYAPSNSFIIFWGADDVYSRLQFVDRNLESYSIPDVSTKSSVPLQHRFADSKKIVKKFPTSDEDDKGIVLMGWVLNPVELDGKMEKMNNINLVEFLCLFDLLAGKPQSYLQKALIDSGLGTSYLGSGDDGFSYVDAHYNFKAGLQGVKMKEGVAEMIESIILETLNKCVTNGFSEGSIESALNSVEFTFRTLTDVGKNSGVSLSLTIAKSFFLNMPLFDIFKYEEGFKSLRDRLKNGEPIFQNLTKKYLLDNSHRVLLCMEPDSNLGGENDEKLNQMLEEKYNSLTDADIEEIKNQAEIIKAYQETKDPPEVVAMLPVLKIEDLERKERIVDYQVTKMLDVEVLISELKSSKGILYLTLGLNADLLSFEDLAIIGLYCDMMTESGTSQLSDVEVANKIGSDTGGISAGFSTFSGGIHPYFVVPDKFSAKSYVFVRGKALEQKIEKLFLLFAELLTDANLSNFKRFVELAKEKITNYENGFREDGRYYATKRVASTIDVAGFASEHTSGLSAYYRLKEILTKAESSWSEVEAMLRSVRNKLLWNDGLIVHISGDNQSISRVLSENHIFNLITKISEFSSTIVKNDNNENISIWSNFVKSNNLMHPHISEIYKVPSLVNSVVMGGRFYDSNETFTGYDYTISNVLSMGYITDEIRLIGGAYGGSFRISRDGCYMFSSYFDPNVEKTLEVFSKTGMNLRNEISLIDDSRITKSIIQTLGIIDKPLTAEEEGFRCLIEHILKRSQEDKQKFRDEIFSVSKRHYEEFADKLENILNDLSKVSISIFACEKKFDELKGSITPYNLEFLSI